MYNGTIISLIPIMTHLSHLSHPYDTFQFCLLLIIKHNPYDIIIHIITLIYFMTLITIILFIHIIKVTIPVTVFNVRSFFILLQLFPMMTVNVLMMKKIGLLGHKLLLHQLSMPGHLNQLLPLPVLCVSVPWHSSVRFLFPRLYVTWQDQILYEE